MTEQSNSELYCLNWNKQTVSMPNHVMLIVSYNFPVDVLHKRWSIASSPEREITLVNLKKDAQYGLGKSLRFFKVCENSKRKGRLHNMGIEEPAHLSPPESPSPTCPVRKCQR